MTGTQETAIFAENFDFKNIVTPINVPKLKNLMSEAGYDIDKSRELIEGFTNGFDLGYIGPLHRQSSANNIPLKIGSPVHLWNKLMKEVQLGRVAGPFDTVPYKFFIQSPIGLVPKDNGKKTRLIFHLSYNFDGKDNSLNHFTPKEICSVKYRDLDHAVHNSLRLKELVEHLPGFEGIFFGRSDLASAFRILPLKRKCWKLLIMKANHPVTGDTKFFADKCVPFGSKRSCALFQQFSDLLQYLVEYLAKRKHCVTNYLDDFLLIGETEQICNQLVRTFLDLCSMINCPVSDEKTEFATQHIIFLGILLDGRNFILAIPEEKRVKAMNMLSWITDAKKVTVKQLQRLTGLLNFLNRALFSGRAFTRRMYAKCSSIKANRKPHHHVKIDCELRFDCSMWMIFLKFFREQALCRPFVDLCSLRCAETLQFFSDASMRIGFGCYYMGRWIHCRWPEGFVADCNPSIAYLELYALVVAVFAWQDLLSNRRIAVYCDNSSVKDMVNNTTSNCKQCMALIRMLVLNNLIHNRRIFVKHIRTDLNILADALSREKFGEFWRNAPSSTRRVADKVPAELFPPTKLWLVK